MSRNRAVMPRLVYIQKIVDQLLLNKNLIRSATDLKQAIDTASTVIQGVKLSVAVQPKDPTNVPETTTTGSLETTTGSLEPTTGPIETTTTGSLETNTTGSLETTKTGSLEPTTGSLEPTTGPIEPINILEGIAVNSFTNTTNENTTKSVNSGNQGVESATDELKILLDMFNESKTDKIELSKHLFNNTTSKEDEQIGKEFNNIFMGTKPKTLNYLESIIIDEYKPAFSNLKERIASIYVKFLLCYFLLKNNNKNSGLVLSSGSTKQLSSIKEALSGLGETGGEDVLKEKIKELSSYIASQEELLTQKENDLQQSKRAVEVTNLQMILSKQQTKEMMDKFVEDAELFSFRVSVLLTITNDISSGIYKPGVVGFIESIKISFTEPTPDTDDPLANQRNRLLKVQNEKINEICDSIIKITRAFQDSYLEIKHLKEESTRYTEMGNVKNFVQIQLLTDKNLKIQELEGQSRHLTGVIEDLGVRLKTSAVKGVVLATAAETATLKGNLQESKAQTADDINAFRIQNEQFRVELNKLRTQVVDNIADAKKKDEQKAKILKQRDHIWATFLQAKNSEEETKKEIVRINHQLSILESGFEEAKAKLIDANDNLGQLVELSRRGALIASLEKELEYKNYEMSLFEQDKNAQIDSLKGIQKRNDAEIARLKKEIDEGLQIGKVASTYKEKELETMKHHIARMAQLTDGILKVQEKIYGTGRSDDTVEGLDLANRIKNEEARPVLESLISIFNQHPLLLTIDKIDPSNLEDMIHKALEATAETDKAIETDAKKVQAENDRLMTEIFHLKQNKSEALGNADKSRAALDLAIKEKEDAEKELDRLREIATSALDVAKGAQADSIASTEIARDAIQAATGAEEKAAVASGERDEAIAKATKAVEEKKAALKGAQDAYDARAKAESAKSVSEAANGSLQKEIQKLETALTSAQELTRQKDAELQEVMSKIEVDRAEAKVEAADEAVKVSEDAADLVGRAVARTRVVESALEVQIKEKKDAKDAAQRAETVATQALAAARAATIEVGVVRGERNVAVAELGRFKTNLATMIATLDSEIEKTLETQEQMGNENILLVVQLSEITQRYTELDRRNDQLTGQLAAIQVDNDSELAKLLSVLKSTIDEKEKTQSKEITKLKSVVAAVTRIVSTGRSSQTTDVQHLLEEIEAVLRGSTV
jgi:hypothetical protein